MKVLVTGAAGRLGSKVCRALAEAGVHDVAGTDRVFRKDLPVPLEVADLLDRTAAYRLLKDREAVVHLGNHPSPYGRNAQMVFNENVTMNMNVLQAAAEVGLRRVIFASSVQVISGTARLQDEPRRSSLPYLPLDGDVPGNPGNAYALSKHVTERMLGYFSRTAAMDCAALRFPFLVRAKYLDEDWDGPPPWGHLDEGFTYLTTEDAAALVAALLDRGPSGFRTYFPASRENSLRRPAEDVAREYYPEVARRNGAGPLETLVDGEALKRDAGWEPSR